MGTPARFRLGVLGSAVAFSTGGAAIKACGLSGWQVACFRSAVAAVALALLLPGARARWTRRTVVVGVTYAATMISFVLANKLTTAANTIFLQSTAPLHVLVLSPLLLREKIRRRDLPFMAAIAAGLAMLLFDSGSPQRTAPSPLLGNVVATFAGLAWALTLLGLRWLARSDGRRGESSLGAVVAGNVIACAICLPWALPVAGSTAMDWGLIAYLGVFQIGLAYVLLTYGFRRVPALEGSLLILLEPTLNPIWAWLFQDEAPGAWALAGGATILATSAARALAERGGAVR